ncbi:MAG: hypothetical protein AB7I04_25295 [Pseudomonadales bacterium]
MKLTAHTIRVKQVSVAQLFLTGLLTGLGLLLLLAAATDDETRIEHFGTALADALAGQVVEPVLARDLIHLGVLANRIITLPEVSGASIHGIDNEPLALSGDVRRGRAFPAQVVHDGQSIGVVRIMIDTDAFGAGLSAGMVAVGALWMLAAPLVVLLLSWLAERPIAPALRRAAKPQPDSPPIVVQEAPEPETWYVIFVNLFNQLSLTREQSVRELSLARAIAQRVASLYSGTVQDLPGSGLLLGFGPGDSDERPFHVLCAAFILSRLLADAESFGRYRLGLHTLTLEPDDTLQAKLEPVRDAAVLSALARDNGIVVSEAFHAAVPYSQRLVSEPLNHPLLEDLDTTGGGARLARSLAEPHDQLVEELLAKLDDQAEGLSTARESTF